ncbi:MAG: elongation factor P maturation arginine rhamnosyltransferase EarP [Treponema sp.]|nr:elongation factor P maturation arginine rhamnosyltransferase EarP [Treponema sp.]
MVDNFGDIGVAWRLCRRLAKIQKQYKICLVVDDFDSFAKIEPSVIASNPSVSVSNPSVLASNPSVIASEAKQSTVIKGIEIFKWQDDELCHKVFKENDGERLGIILELFQCGRPDWMEQILFEEKLEHTVQIIMIDYLTAEKYAEDFHCLQSLTRSAKVKKVNFMPGFTDKTGGLIIDEAWEQMPQWNKDGPVLEFTYKTKCAYLHSAESLRHSKGSKDPSKIKLSFMPQTDWDQMMRTCSALIVRGEESMSRACLSGIPFIWQAYPQSEEYQLVKVKALLERMRPHFSEEAFAIVEKAWMAINTTNSMSLRGANEVSDVAIYDFLNARSTLVPYFQDFAKSLQKNGDLCTNLMTFIQKLAII